MEDVCGKIRQKKESLLGRYHLKELWECEWTRLKQSRPDIQACVGSLQLVEPLNPCDAFCGGRTNAIKLYHHVTPCQKIHYIDYTSWYPWVNKTCSTPKVIPRSSRNRVKPTLMTTLVSCNAKYYRHVNYTIPCCLTVTLVNSPFLSVSPACKTKWPNLPCRDLTSAHTPITNAP